MNMLVVYFSKFGNTGKVAQAIAETLESAGTVHLMTADQLTAANLNDVDLLVMGTPTHKMNLPEALLPVLESLPKRALKGIAVAAFDTSYKMSWWLNHFTAAKPLARKLRKLGGKQIIPPEIFLVEAKKGPLYAGELERARNWAGALLDNFAQAARPSVNHAPRSSAYPARYPQG